MLWLDSVLSIGAKLIDKLIPDPEARAKAQLDLAKLAQEGKQLVKIDKWYPSSKTCSCCGNVKAKLGLGERVYICENCGIELDRDYNASLNIKRVGMTQLAW